MGKRGDFVKDTIYGAHLKGTNYGVDSGHGESREFVISRMYERMLTQMCITRFEWSNLPPGINHRFLELTLFRRAMALFWHDDMYNKYFATMGTVNGPLNYYNEPTRYQSFGLGLAARNITPGVNGVPIWANYLRIPDLDIVQIYAQRLANFDRTIEINGRNARSPRIIAIPQNMQLTASQINKQIEDGAQTITVNYDSLANPNEVIQSLDMGIHPDSLEKLSIVKGRIWSECMGLLGIKHANQDKKERLVVDEVNSNDEQIAMTRYVNLVARREAVEQINSLYGLNISVDYRADQEMSFDLGNLHNGTTAGNDDDGGQYRVE